MHANFFFTFLYIYFQKYFGGDMVYTFLFNIFGNQPFIT